MIKTPFSKLIYILVPLILGATACSDALEINENLEGFHNEKVVTVEVNLQPYNGGTRVGLEDRIPYISNGSKVDELIFCLYEKQEDGKYEPIEGDGQHSVDMSNKSWPYTVRLSLDPSKTYTIAFWAQKKSDESLKYVSPYDTSDLRKIKVNYTDEHGNAYLSNNCEYMDAFCGSLLDFKVGTANNKVYLHRPFAQINIGTTGADYANLIYDKYLIPSKVTVTESRIKVTGVANCFNALTGEAKAFDFEEEKEAEGDLSAEFGWALLPAWINSGIPTWQEPGTEFDENNPYPFIKFPSDSEQTEEFLIVDLDKTDGQFKPYKVDYPTINKWQDQNDVTHIDYLTETFKYLSMSYVLVPSSKYGRDENSGTTIELEYDLRQNIENKEKISLTERTILLVPAQANYRTNLLCGINTTANPDPTSIFNVYQFPIVLIDNFVGDKNEKYYTSTLNIHRDKAELDGLEISYTNGQEIQLSDDNKEFEFVSQTVFFIGEKSEYTFTVKQDYKVEIVTNIELYDNKGNKRWNVSDPVTENNKTSVTLTLYPESTAVQFHIYIKENITEEEPEIP